MGSFAVYMPLKPEQIRKMAKEATEDIGPKIPEFFKNNPKRKSCTIEVWYGRTVDIKPTDDVGEVLMKFAEETIAEDGKRTPPTAKAAKPKAAPKKAAKKSK